MTNKEKEAAIEEKRKEFELAEKELRGNRQPLSGEAKINVNTAIVQEGDRNNTKGLTVTNDGSEVFNELNGTIKAFSGGIEEVKDENEGTR